MGLVFREVKNTGTLAQRKPGAAQCCRESYLTIIGWDTDFASLAINNHLSFKCLYNELSGCLAERLSCSLHVICLHDARACPTGDAFSTSVAV